MQLVGVSGYFKPREKLADEPIYRNVWTLLREFGDAELAALVAPRFLHIENTLEPRVKGPPVPKKGRSGAAPGSLRGDSDIELVQAEFARAEQLSYKALKLSSSRLAAYNEMFPGGERWFKSSLTSLGRNEKRRAYYPDEKAEGPRKLDPAPRQKRQFEQLVNY